MTFKQLISGVLGLKLDCTDRSVDAIKRETRKQTSAIATTLQRQGNIQVRVLKKTTTYYIGDINRFQ